MRTPTETMQWYYNSIRAFAAILPHNGLKADILSFTQAFILVFNDSDSTYVYIIDSFVGRFPVSISDQDHLSGTKVAVSISFTSIWDSRKICYFHIFG